MNRRSMRWVQAGLVLALAVVWVWQVGAAETKPAAQTPVQRGEYLVNQVARCDTCHTPRDAQGQLDLSRNLQGAKIGVVPKVRPKEWEEEAPDITAGGVGGKWNEPKMMKFLMTGSPGANAPMPEYRLNEEDARAVTTYLKSLAGGKGAATRSSAPAGRGERGDD